MTILAIGARRRGQALYQFPTARPYNAPVPAVTPTYDGTTQAVHPSVVDMHRYGGDWHGFRYWMAMTPYPNTNDRYENPSVLASHDGYRWQVPAGLTNPIYPAPNAPGFNSDTHLHYDPTADELVMLYRATLNTVAFTYYVLRSSDGVTWTPRVDIQLPASVQILSPALVRVGAGDWRLFGLTRSPDPKLLKTWTAAAPEGPWTGPFDCQGLRTVEWPWHLDVLYHDSLFWLTVDRGPAYLGAPDGFRAAISRDGITWVHAADDFMATGPTGGWDSTQLYRATIQPHEDGDKFRMWYSAESDAGPWGTGLTHIPEAEWPQPPALPSGSGTAYREAVLADSPAVYWRLSDASYTTAADASGNGRTGTFVGEVGRGVGLIPDADGGVILDGWGRVVRTHEAWMEATAYTVECVVKFTDLNGERSAVSLGSDGTGFRLGKSSTDNRPYWVHAGYTHKHTGVTIQQGVTYHLAWATDGSTGYLYVNGQPSAQATGLALAAIGAGDLTAGCAYTSTGIPNWKLTGNLDEVAYYPGVTLSAARILAHAQAAGLA